MKNIDKGAFQWIIYYKYEQTLISMYESFSNSGENNPKLYSEERDDKDNHHDCF